MALLRAPEVTVLAFLALSVRHRACRLPTLSKISRQSTSISPLMSGKKITVKKADEKDKDTASDWPTWGCGVSKFPWTYGEKETCVVLQGEVIVTPDGGGEPVTIKAGDMATFPAGLSCTWDVKSPLKKHYNFG